MKVFFSLYGCLRRTDTVQQTGVCNIVSLAMKGCICHYLKWQIHPFIANRAICLEQPFQSSIKLTDKAFFERVKVGQDS